MNNTITLPQVITQLAKLTNTDANTARLFLRAFFANIEKNLAAGETVVIKNIGTFKRSDDPTFGASEGVVFVPDKVITDEINAPFAMFSAVELADGISEADLAPAEPAAQTEPEEIAAETPAQTTPEAPEIVPEPKPEAVPAAEPEATPEVKETAPATEPAPMPQAAVPQEPITPAPAVEIPKPTPAVAAPKPAAPKPQPSVRPVAPPPPAVTEDDEEETAAPAPKRKSRIWLWAVLLIIAAVVGGYFAAVYAVPDFEWDDEIEAAEEEIPTEPLPEIDVDEASIGDAGSHAEEINPAAASESTPAAPPAEQAPAQVAESAPAAAAAAPKYDTVTSTRYLSTMAREYYGQNIFWVYIYEANKDHLGDPNKVGAGTRVIIPDKSSLPQAASQKEAIRMAEKKAAEIQARFKK